MGLFIFYSKYLIEFSEVLKIKLEFKIIFEDRVSLRNLRLVDASLAVAEGDLSQRVSAEGNDEIGQLSRTFNGMAASLEQSTQEREALLTELIHSLLLDSRPILPFCYGIS